MFDPPREKVEICAGCRVGRGCSCAGGWRDGGWRGGAQQRRSNQHCKAPNITPKPSLSSKNCRIFREMRSYCLGEARAVLSKKEQISQVSAPSPPSANPPHIRSSQLKRARSPPFPRHPIKARLGGAPAPGTNHPAPPNQRAVYLPYPLLGPRSKRVLRC